MRSHPFSLIGRQGRRRFLIVSGQIAGITILSPLSRLFGATPPGKGPGGAPVPVLGAPAGLPAWLGQSVADLEKSYPYASALYTCDDAVTVQASSTGVTATQQGPWEGIVLSVSRGGGFEEDATSLVTSDGIAGAARRLLALPAPVDRAGGPEPGAPLEKSWVDAGSGDRATTDLATQVEMVRALREKILKRDPRLASVTVQATIGATERLFVNRARRLHQALGRCRLDVQAVRVVEGGRPAALDIRHGGVGGVELLAFDDAAIDQFLARLARLSSAAAPTPGEIVVVSEPQISGVLAHEAFGHGVEADLFVTGRARAADYVGRTVGSPLVQILDDPTQPAANGFYHFDDEGTTPSPTHIVEAGVFKGPLTDMQSARALKLARTGNGRRESFSHKTYVRMSNTFFARGTTPPGELIAGVKSGLLVAHLSAGIEDPRGWGVQVVAQYGEEIRDGRLTGRVVSPVTLSGYVPDVLQSVDGVGNDFQLEPGVCGKGYKEWVPVSTGGPHLRFRARVS